MKPWIAAALLLASQMAMGMVFQLQPCQDALARCVPAIAGTGVVLEGDASRLRAAVAAWRLAGRDVGPLVMTSRGGSIAAAVELGLEVRRLGLDTLARAQLSGPLTGPAFGPLFDRGCHSSCVFAFVGGRQRRVESGAVLTVQKLTLAREPGGRSADEGVDLGVLLRDYVQSMGVDPQLVALAMNTGGGAVRVLHHSEISAWRVDSHASSAPAWEVTVAADGAPSVRLSKELSGGKAVHVSIGKARGLAVVRLVLTFDAEMYRVGELSRFPLNGSPDVTLSTDGSIFRAQALTPWEARQTFGIVYFESIVALPLSAAHQLRSVQSFRLQDAVSRASAAARIRQRGTRRGRTRRWTEARAGGSLTARTGWRGR